MESMTLDRLEQLRGTPVYDSAGEKIGSVEEVFYDEQTRRPEWIGIGTGFLGTKRVLVPVEGSSLEGDAVTVSYAKEHVKDSPDVDSDLISPELEQELYSYYGIPYSDESAAPDQGIAREPDSPGDVSTGEPSVTRSEEELRVGKEQTEAGRVRLHKWVETEPVSVEVELTREKARVVREPADGTVGEGETGDEEAEITLHEERPVVARERVRLEKDVESERRTVSDELRKERVEVEGNTDGADRR
jgi:stress response protein YsnF